MEIGSEFWLDNSDLKNNYKIKENDRNQILFMSGRTAIDYAINLIKEKRKIQKIYFPSYCCQSMLQPFIEEKIKIEFYDVYLKEGHLVYDIDCNKNCDLFYAMNYFGYSKYNMDYYINEFRKRNILVLEDSTHSWLSNRKYNNNSDLVIASLRKWFPIISGGILISNSKEFDLNNIEKVLKVNSFYNYSKEMAMKEKFQFINNQNKIPKSQFLLKFSKANEILKKDYKNYKIDDKSYIILKEKLDIENIKEKRKKNVEIIYKYIKECPNIAHFKDIDLENDCQIFVPIFLKNQEKRDKLKKIFIENQIYCPNHWEIPELITNEKQREIYNRELSLICDQRYTIEDIKKYLNYINLEV